MSKTRPSSSSMGATPPQRRAERVEHSQQHVRRGAEQPRGGARNAWGRKGERDGGRRSRGDEEENFFKSRPGSQKSRFSLPLQPESNCTVFVLEVVPPQRRVGSFFDKKSTEIDVVLYPTYFHSPPPFAHHFPPVPPAPLGRLRPPRADRSRSGFTQGQRGPRVVYTAVYAARAGKHGPP
jgi:hypothetical protein